MTQDWWTSEPFAIHVGVNETIAKELEVDARSGGGTVIVLDLSRVHDRQALVDELSRTFQFPHDARGLDAVVDLVSDLDWLDESAGFLLLVH